VVKEFLAITLLQSLNDMLDQTGNLLSRSHICALKYNFHQVVAVILSEALSEESLTDARILFHQLNNYFTQRLNCSIVETFSK
jgi:hypothetical protein